MRTDAQSSSGATAGTGRLPVPDREIRSPYFRFALHLGLPLAVSLGVHVGIVGLMGWKTFSTFGQRGSEIGEYHAGLTDVSAETTAEPLDWSANPDLRAPDDRPLAPSVDLPASLSDIPSPDVSSLGSSAGGDDSGLAGIGDGALAILGTGGGGVGGAGTGGLGSGLGSSSRLGEASVWGVSTRGERIVYVVDFSGSIMLAEDDLKRELKRSIGRLKPPQSFNVVIFYSSGGGPDERVRTESFKPQLEPAAEKARRDCFAWLARKAPSGRTEPLQAMQTALAMRPDTVFFLSDGEFEDRVVEQIQAANSGVQAQIHCLVFDDEYLRDASGLPIECQGGCARLRRIAEANGGQLKIVTSTDLPPR